jgi:hypothetical protein
MSSQESKNSLKESIHITSKNLFETINKIPDDFRKQPLLNGHSKGEMISVSNELAYLRGWAVTILNAIRAKNNSKNPELPWPGYKWNELGRLAAFFYSMYNSETFDLQIKNYKDTLNEILDEIDQKSDSELYETGWYKKYSLGRMIRLNTTAPMKNATIRIRKLSRNLPLSETS